MGCSDFQLNPIDTNTLYVSTASGSVRHINRLNPRTNPHAFLPEMGNSQIIFVILHCSNSDYYSNNIEYKSKIVITHICIREVYYLIAFKYWLRTVKYLYIYWSFNNFTALSSSLECSNKYTLVWPDPSCSSTCVCVCPHLPSYLLVGCSDGSVRLHSTSASRPLTTWPPPNNPKPVINITWSSERPCVFYVHEQQW